MNEEIILKLVEPYLKDKSITYDEFDNIFSFLSYKEQYAVTDILCANNILLRDDEEVNIDIDDGKAIIENVESFEALYDVNIFKDKIGVDNRSTYVKTYSSIKQSNEILCSLIQEGNAQAKQDLCVKNKKLVQKYAYAYQKYCGNKLDVEDIEQVGFIGLIKASERFDVSLGYSFSTYATYWIRQSIVREIFDHGFAIRIPVHMMEQINKVTRVDNQLEMHGLNYSERITKIAEELTIPSKLVEECFVIRNQFLSLPSLNAPVGEEENTEFEELVISDEEMSIEDIVSLHVLREMIRSVLQTLTEREKKILDLRFGLTDGHARTLEEIGYEFNVTRERIRQIEKKALRKLRHPSRSRKLKDFL